MSAGIILILTVVALIICGGLYSMRRERIRVEREKEAERLTYERLSECDKIIYKVKSEKSPAKISLNNIYEIQKRKYDDPDTERIRREVYGADGLREERKQNMQAQRDVIAGELEGEGRIEEALVLYEENVRTAVDTSTSYERLTRIYRESKRYDDEIRIIKKYLKMWPNSEKYIKRLTHAKALKEKGLEQIDKDGEETKKSQ